MKNRNVDFPEELSSVFHYPKEDEPRYERGTRCCVSDTGTVWGLANYQERQKRVVRLRGGDSEQIYPMQAGAHPNVCLYGETPVCTWVEKHAEGWRIIVDAPSVCAHREAYRSEGLCMNPVPVIWQQRLVLLWSGLNRGAGAMQIMAARYGADGWSEPVLLSSGGADAWRPAAAVQGGQLLAVWDASSTEGQWICGRILQEDGGMGEIFCLKRPGERLLRPTAAPLHGAEGGFGIACIAIRDVRDRRLDIADHSTGIAFARLCGGELQPSADWAASLDEGLLGIKNYVPYYGIRRKCTLADTRGGSLWLLWEMRFEDSARIPAKESPVSDEHYGWLVGKQWKNGCWGPARILHEGGTCYSACGGESIHIAWLEQENVFLRPVLHTDVIETGGAPELCLDRSGAERWDSPLAPEPALPRRTCGDWQLLWGDTHNHGAYSPDAEGDPDDLMRFGRDIARLDFMALVENGYYPHAGLLPGEWEEEQALAAHYTEQDRFVVLPGYEFSHHDASKTPNFNHRYVLFSRGGPYWDRLNPETRDVASLVSKLEHTDALLVAHHPNFTRTHSEKDQYIEIVSSWRVTMEEKDFVQKRLAMGERFAFIGSSDCHRACPGFGGALTGVFAREFTPEGIMDAIRHRRTIATQGQRILIVLYVDRLFIGEEGAVARHPMIRIRIEGEKDLEFVELLCDNVPLRRWENCGASLSAEFPDQTSTPGEHFYYIRLKTAGESSFNEPDSVRSVYSGPFVRTGAYSFNFANAHGPFAWSTPIWADLGAEQGSDRVSPENGDAK